MSTSITLVVARWAQPLTGLRANAALGDVVADATWSWRRADGWQCFSPDGQFYDGRLLPPVEEIERETGGPVLGLGVESSVHWEVGFRLEGRPCWIADGPSERGSADDVADAMVRLWGTDWRRAAASALARWAGPGLEVRPDALEAAMSVPWLFAEDAVADLLRLLTLVPDESAVAAPHLARVQEASIPGALYAVDAAGLHLDGISEPADAYGTPGAALVLTALGYGIWDRPTAAWAVRPGLAYDAAESALREHLLERGWERHEVDPWWSAGLG